MTINKVEAIEKQKRPRKKKLEQIAAMLLLLFHLQSSPSGILENFPHPLLAFGRAFEISESVDFFGHGAPILGLDGFLFHLLQLVNRVGVVAQILLVPDQNDGHIGAEVFHFGRPFLRDILEGIGRVDRKAHEDDVGVGIREGAQAVVVFLAGRIPQGQLHLFAIYLDVGDVILEDGRHVHLGELVFAEDDQKARFAASTVAHNH